MNETSLVTKVHGENTRKDYLPILSTWSLEFSKTLIAISVAILAGQLILLERLSPTWHGFIAFAILSTAISLLSALQTILTTKNCLYIIVRDATRAAGIPEPDADPFRTEKVEWLEKLHHKTWRRIFISNTLAMASFSAGVVLTIAPVALSIFP